MNPVCKIIQPLLHKVICQWGRKNERNCDKPDKLLREQKDDLTDCGSQGFSDADFFCPAFCHERNQPKESDTTDEDGDARENSDQVRTLSFTIVKFCNRV